MAGACTALAFDCTAASEVGDQAASDQLGDGFEDRRLIAAPSKEPRFRFF